MFRCYSYTIIRERVNLCLLKLQLLKWSVKIHRCVVNTVVVWLHILSPYQCFFFNFFVLGTPHHHHIKHTPMYFNGLF